MSGSNEDHGPYDRDQQSVCIVTVPDTGTLTVRFLGPVTGIWTHWHGGKSLACIGEDSCPPALHRERTIWKGYAAVEYIKGRDPALWVPGVLEVTEALSEYLNSDNPRGEVWRLQRAKVTTSRAECRGQLIRNDDPRPLRLDVEVEAAVKRLYRCLWVKFGMPPPFGARQRLAPIAVIPIQGESAPSVNEADEQADREKAKAIIRAALQGGSPSNGGRKGKNNA